MIPGCWKESVLRTITVLPFTILLTLTLCVRVCIESFCIFGDGGYHAHGPLACPFVGATLSPQESNFNLAMSRVRIAVEWSFKEILRLWCHFRYLPLQRVF